MELLESKKNINKKVFKLYSLFDGGMYPIFGILLPSKSVQVIDMPELESEESAAQREQGQGLNILTPKQMIIRLPILLAQLKAGNNYEKLKN